MPKLVTDPVTVSSLDFINAYDVGLVLMAYSDSVIRMWHLAEANRESALVTGIKVETCDGQKSLTIITVGKTIKYFRLLDAERELNASNSIIAAG